MNAVVVFTLTISLSFSPFIHTLARAFLRINAPLTLSLSPFLYTHARKIYFSARLSTMKRSNTAAKRRILASLFGDFDLSASSGSFHLFSSGKFNSVKFFSFSRAAAASSFPSSSTEWRMRRMRSVVQSAPIHLNEHLKQQQQVQQKQIQIRSLNVHEFHFGLLLCIF